ARPAVLRRARRHRLGRRDGHERHLHAARRHLLPAPAQAAHARHNRRGGEGMNAGVAYFGSRIPRHVAADMETLAARGLTGVLHTFSETDLAYYRETMGRIVAASHDCRLEVQIAPWGVCQMFGGEAESRFTAHRRDVGQVLDDETPTPS